MKKTYDEILNEMKNEFYDKCGENVEQYSELDLRFKAVASELYSLFCSSEFVLRQAFPQTAQGSYLDFHAQLRGMRRKTAGKAKLNLIFSLNEASESDTIIEEGCICASHDNPYNQFITLDDAYIPSGETSASVEAEAVLSGSIGNVEADTVTVIVNPVLTVAGVTNEAPYELGFDDESDEMLRRRILSAYSVPSTGFSLLSLREAILSIDEILDCSVSNDGDELLVAVKTKNGFLGTRVRQKIEDKLFATDLYSYDKTIVSAQRKSVSFKLDVKCSIGDYDRIEAEIKKNLKSLTSQLCIGECLYFSDIIYRASRVEGVEYCEVVCRDAVEGIILCEADEYICAEEPEVICHE